MTSSEPSDKGPPMRSPIEELLPWYATGRLGAEDASRVEDALAGDAKLAAGLACVQEDRDAAIGLNSDLGVPSRAALARVMAVAAAEPRRPTFTGHFRALFARPLAQSWPAWAGIAAVAVIAVETGIITTGWPLLRSPGFQTASDTSPQGGGIVLLVAFAPGADLDRVSDLLGHFGATIVDGPKAGLFRLRIAPKAGSPDRDALIASLRADPLVRAVLPAPGR